jgi:hypothetical protein
MRLEFRYQPHPGRPASTYGTSRFSSQSRRAKSRRCTAGAAASCKNPGHRSRGHSRLAVRLTLPHSRSGGCIARWMALAMAWARKSAPPTTLKKARMSPRLQCPANELAATPPTGTCTRNTMHTINATQKRCDASLVSSATLKAKHNCLYQASIWSAFASRRTWLSVCVEPLG